MATSSFERANLLWEAEKHAQKERAKEIAMANERERAQQERCQEDRARRQQEAERQRAVQRDDAQRKAMERRDRAREQQEAAFERRVQQAVDERVLGAATDPGSLCDPTANSLAAGQLLEINPNNYLHFSSGFRSAIIR